MKIAILGATSQIAKDLILSISKAEDYSLALFARRPEVVSNWLNLVNLKNRYTVQYFDEFHSENFFDVVINFVGVGNPAQAVEMGNTIFEVTLKFDELVLQYLNEHPACRYIFLSSGSVYGANFDRPVDETSHSLMPVNNFHSQDWYSLAKLHAEGRHRALSHRSIVDIRVFNYFSHSQDLSARFLITDIFRSIRSKELLRTSTLNIVRDFLNPTDFFRLINSIIQSPGKNLALDCYTKAPIDKLSLLLEMQSNFGLKYEIDESFSNINATGAKQFYFSNNRVAKKFGYAPLLTSLDGVLKEAEKMLQSNLLA